MPNKILQNRDTFNPSSLIQSTRGQEINGAVTKSPLEDNTTSLVKLIK
jgi:hypothetical protein